jgi:hypothetical protein
MMARAGSQSTFKESCEDLKIYAGIEASAKDVERVAEGIGQEMEVWSSRQPEGMVGEDAASSSQSIPILYISYDGTGVPMTEKELQGRPGKQADGSSKTRCYLPEYLPAKWGIFFRMI